MKTYQVTGYDGDGCTVVSREAFTLKAAREEMRLQRTDESYSDIRCIQVTDDETGDVILDWLA